MGMGMVGGSGGGDMIQKRLRGRAVGRQATSAGWQELLRAWRAVPSCWSVVFALRDTALAAVECHSTR